MMTLRELPAAIRRAVRTGTNLRVLGEPGMGKTSVTEQTVADFQQEDPNFWYNCIYTPSLSPTDFVAMMPDQATQTLKPYLHDKLPNRYDNPDLKGILFLGEADNADPATNKALQKYVNNEDLGGLQKPAGIVVIADSNAVGHRSGAVQQSLAFISRFRELSVSVDPECTLKYFGDKGVNPYVQAYLSLRKEHVTTFEQILKDRAYRVWANPRAWERLGTGLDDADASNEKLGPDEIIGDVGEAVGREFVAFMYAAKELVSYAEIVADPKSAHRPDKLADVYAIIAMLAVSVLPTDMAQVRVYVERFNAVEVEVLFLRLMVSSKGPNRDANCRTKAYTEWFAKGGLRSALGV